MQSEITSGNAKQIHEWLISNTDPKKTTALLNILNMMVETRVFKVLTVMVSRHIISAL